MYLYVELWNARQKWLDLPQQERQQYFEKVGASINELTDQGVEIVGFALNDEETPHRSDHRYIAVWKMPSLELVELLEESVEQAGFHDYFDQVNARGELISPPEALQDMAAL